MADPQSPPSAKPRAGAFDRPAVPTKPSRRLDHSPGDPRSDPTPAQMGVAAPVIVGLVGVELPGRRRRRPLGMRIGRMSSNTASSMVD